MMSKVVVLASCGSVSLDVCKSKLPYRSQEEIRGFDKMVLFLWILNV